MAVRVNAYFRLRQGAIDGLSAPGGMIDQATARAAGRIRDRASRIIVSEGRVDTGTLARGITVDRADAGRGGVTYRVESPQPYAIFQHDGTRTPIRPRRARVLRFVSGGKVVFARQVRGVQGIRYLERAAAESSPADFT